MSFRCIFRYIGLNKTNSFDLFAIFLFFNLAMIKFKIIYVAHILFLLDSTGLEHVSRKRNKKGDMNGVPQ